MIVTHTHEHTYTHTHTHTQPHTHTHIYIADIARILGNMPRGRKQYCPNELASEGNIAFAQGAYLPIFGLYLIYYMTEKYMQVMKPHNSRHLKVSNCLTQTRKI